MTNQASNEFAPDGTKTIFTYYGDRAELVNPITGKKYEVTPIDSMLYESVPPGSHEFRTNKHAYEDLTIHKRKKECAKCGRPIMEHLLVGTTSMMMCLCGHQESN